MPERDHNSTDGAGLPWAFVLDPVANAAAINDVQRQGLEAARRLIDRIVAKSESSSVDGRDEPRTRPDPGVQPQQGDSLAELIRCWAQLTTEVLGKLGETRGQPTPTGSETAPTTAVSVDGSGPGSSKHCLDVDSRGRLFAASEIRLTNPSAQSVGPSRPSCGGPAHTRRQATRRRQCPVRSFPGRRSPSRVISLRGRRSVDHDHTHTGHLSGRHSIGGSAGSQPGVADHRAPPRVVTVTTHSAEADAVETVLRQVSQDVRRAMLEAVPDGEPHKWLYQLCAPTRVVGGRPFVLRSA